MKSIRDARVVVLGLTFKENVPDLRNSKVPNIIDELREFGINPIVHDPVADPGDAVREYGIELSGPDTLVDLDAMILAVGHEQFESLRNNLSSMLDDNGVIIDVKSLIEPSSVPKGREYWSL